MRTIAIGDIHGCAKALKALIEAIQPGPGDLIVTLGDYIDRGPDSKGVLDQLLALEQRCRLRPLLGNHELILLQALEDPAEREFWLVCGGDKTLASYGDGIDDIPDLHIAFIENCRPHFETPDHLFVHANYVHDLPLAEQPEYALFWEHLSYQVPPPHDSGKRVIVGHTPQPSGEILDLEHVVCIDTWCFGDGFLTALDVESNRVWQADKQGRLRVKSKK